MGERGWIIILLWTIAVPSAAIVRLLLLRRTVRVDDNEWKFIAVGTLVGGLTANAWYLGIGPTVDGLNLAQALPGGVIGAVVVEFAYLMFIKVGHRDQANRLEAVGRFALAALWLISFLAYGVLLVLAWVRDWRIGIAWLVVAGGIWASGKAAEVRAGRKIVRLLFGIAVGGAEWLALVLWFKLRSSDLSELNRILHEHAFDFATAGALAGASLYFPRELWQRILWFMGTMATIGLLTGFSMGGGWYELAVGSIAGLGIGAWVNISADRLSVIQDVKGRLVGPVRRSAAGSR